MKNALLLIALALVPSFAFSQEVVENPDFYGRNTKVVKITKVETTDKETILHVTLTVPNSNTSIRIASSTRLEDLETDRTFRLRKAVGFKLDKYQALRNNTAVFTLIFNRLPDDIHRVDFIEGEGKGDFKIYGLQVKDTPYMEMEQTDKYKYYYDTHTLIVPNNSEERVSFFIPDKFFSKENTPGEMPEVIPHPKTGRGLRVISVKHME